MADEYINKKDVVNLGVMMQTHLWTREQTYNAIFCLPSANVAPVRHGIWEDYEENTWQCSECGEPFYLEDGTPQENEYNYCPYCGAKMDKEKDDAVD